MTFEEVHLSSSGSGIKGEKVFNLFQSWVTTFLILKNLYFALALDIISDNPQAPLYFGDSNLDLIPKGEGNLSPLNFSHFFNLLPPHQVLFKRTQLLCKETYVSSTQALLPDTSISITVINIHEETNGESQSCGPPHQQQTPQNLCSYVPHQHPHHLPFSIPQHFILFPPCFFTELMIIVPCALCPSTSISNAALLSYSSLLLMPLESTTHFLLIYLAQSRAQPLHSYAHHLPPSLSTSSLPLSPSPSSSLSSSPSTSSPSSSSCQHITHPPSLPSPSSPPPPPPVFLPSPPTKTFSTPQSPPNPVMFLTDYYY